MDSNQNMTGPEDGAEIADCEQGVLNEATTTQDTETTLTPPTREESDASTEEEVFEKGTFADISVQLADVASLPVSDNVPVETSPPDNLDSDPSKTLEECAPPVGFLSAHESGDCGPGAYSMTFRQESSHSYTSSSANEGGSDLEEPAFLASAELVDEELHHEVERLRREVEASLTVPVAVAKNDAEEPSPCGRYGYIALLIAVLTLGVAILTLGLTEKFTGSSGTDPVGRNASSALDVLAEDESFGLFYGALEVNGIADDLRSGMHGPVTIFAMRNTTYKAITEAQAESKAPRFLGIHNPKNELQSRALLYMHIYAGSINLTGTVGTEDFTMINNETITISTEQDMISIRPGMSGDVEVIEPNIVTENGDTIHVINGIFEPAFVTVSMLEFLERMNLTDTIDWIRYSGVDSYIMHAGGITILAPSNEANAALNPQVRERLLNDDQYLALVTMTHVLGRNYPIKYMVEGETVGGVKDIVFVRKFTNDDGSIRFSVDGGTSANVILSDQFCNDGVVHVLDGFLLPHEV